MSSQFSAGKRPLLIFKRIAWILLPCVATAFIVRSYYLVRECETRKIEEVIRDGIVALNQKDKSCFLQLLSEEVAHSLDGAESDRYFDSWEMLPLNPGKTAPGRLQVVYVDMGIRLSTADAYLYTGCVPDFPLLPFCVSFSVNGISSFLFGHETRFESLEEWTDGRMTFKFSAKKEKGMWKLSALPELICE